MPPDTSITSLACSMPRGSMSCRLSLCTEPHTCTQGFTLGWTPPPFQGDGNARPERPTERSPGCNPGSRIKHDHRRPERPQERCLDACFSTNLRSKTESRKPKQIRKERAPC